MIIEKVCRYMTSNSGQLSNSRTRSERVVLISLPRVRWLEGSESAEKYLTEEQLKREESFSKYAGLNLSEREKVLLDYVERKVSYGQMAKNLGVTKSTIKSALVRLRQKIKERENHERLAEKTSQTEA